MIIGDVPIDGFYVQDGHRYQRISLSSSIKVNAAGDPIGQGFSHEPLDEVEPDRTLGFTIHETFDLARVEESGDYILGYDSMNRVIARCHRKALVKLKILTSTSEIDPLIEENLRVKRDNL